MERELYESGKLSERIRENFKYLTGEGRGSAGLAAAPPVPAQLLCPLQQLLPGIFVPLFFDYGILL